MNPAAALILGGLILLAIGILEIRKAGGLGTMLAGIIVGFLGFWFAGIGVLRAAF